MFRAPVIFPIAPDKLILEQMKTTLVAGGFSAGLTVDPRRPKDMTRRVVTLRNDGGPRDRQGLRAYGVNVWADSLVDATNMSNLLQRDIALLGSPFTRIDRFTEPIEIDDDPQMTVQVSSMTKNLEHVYFTFRAQYRGTTPQ